MSPYKGIVPNSKDNKMFQDSWDYVSNNYSKSKKLRDKVVEILKDHDKALLEDDADLVPDDGNLPSDDSKHAPPVPVPSPPVRIAAASRRGGGNTNTNAIADSGVLSGAGGAALAGTGGAVSLGGGADLNANGSAVSALNGRKGRGRREYGQRRKKIPCPRCGKQITNNAGTLAKHEEACSRSVPAPAAAPVLPRPAPPAPAPAAVSAAFSSARGNSIGGFAAAAKPATEPEEEEDDDDDDDDDALGVLQARVDAATAPTGPMSMRAIASALAALSPEAGGGGLAAIGGDGGGGCDNRPRGTGQLKDDRDYASDEDDGGSNADIVPEHFTFSPERLSASRPKSSRNGVAASKPRARPEMILGNGDGRPSPRTPIRRTRLLHHQTPHLVTRTPKTRGHQKEPPSTVDRSDPSRDGSRLVTWAEYGAFLAVQQIDHQQTHFLMQRWDEQNLVNIENKKRWDEQSRVNVGFEARLNSNEAVYEAMFDEMRRARADAEEAEDALRKRVEDNKKSIEENEALLKEFQEERMLRRNMRKE